MKVCIIGAGDAGAIAALQIRRLDRDAQIDVFSRRPELGCPPCEMPLVLERSIATFEELFRGLRAPRFYEKRNIPLHLGTEVTEIRRSEKRLIAGGESYPYDKLILALGAVPCVPSLPGLDGINEFSMSTDVEDGRALDRAISEHSSAAVVGGGFLALEVAAALKSRGYEKIHLLVRQDVMRAYLDTKMAENLRQVIVDNGIDLIMPGEIRSVERANGKKRIFLADRDLEVDFIFFGSGSRPNTELAEAAGLEKGESGAIAVNRYLQTSDPDIYAAGDCMENWDMITGSKRCHHLATNSIRNGYIAGRNIVLGNQIPYEGTVMPFVTKVFDHTVGAVGFTEREAQEKGKRVVSATAETPWLKERFGGRPARYKVIADLDSETLVGVQIISEENVSGTIDKLAVGIGSRMPLMKLLQIDSCYSPHVQENQIAVPIQRLIDRVRKEKTGS